MIFKMNNGEVYNTNSCGKIEIVNYITARKVLVRFLNTGYEKHFTKYWILNGSIKDPFKPTLYGKGYIGEGEYKTSKTSEHIKIYRCWSHMLERCYSSSFHSAVNYRDRGISVCKEWLCYQNFARWYEENYIEGFELDKDLSGGKEYNPENCHFVPSEVNKFLTNRRNFRNDLPVGVTRGGATFQASCCNGEGKGIYLGSFKTPEEAFQTYRKEKIKVLNLLIEKYVEILPSRTLKVLSEYDIVAFPE